MTRQIEALLLDDDEWALQLIKLGMEESLPELKISTRLDPEPLPGYDVYFIDNEFDGVTRAPELSRQIRTENPNSLIIAFSSTLDAACLKQLINAGCDGACDKSLPDDLNRALLITKRFVEARRQEERRRRRGIVGAIDSIRGLLSEWNQRLDQERSAEMPQPKTTATAKRAEETQ